jgi:energy-converting hydrogenase B subunit D
MIFDLIQGMLLAGILASACVAMRKRDLLVSVIFLAVMSMLLSLEFYILRAPDVAIAEAAIGAGLTTAVYIVAINRTSRWENEKRN